jgi:glutamate synthase domain-containing protein 1
VRPVCSTHHGPLEPQGLYAPGDEHDACGVGFVVHTKGKKSHDIVVKALQVLINLEHRGACGCEGNTGDGAGILLQIPDGFLRGVLPFELPPLGQYGAGLVFLPHDAPSRNTVKALLEKIAAEEGQHVLGWRAVPTDNRLVGDSARAAQPVFEQVFIAAGPSLGTAGSRATFERKLYVIR